MSTGDAVPTLDVQHIAVLFGARPGLRDVSFAVPGGECVAVLGASGAGKSTLLRAIAGLHPLRQGRVGVSGRDVSSLPPEVRNVVYLHQEPVLFPHLTVLDNVAFPQEARGRNRRHARDTAQQWLERMHVGTLGDRTPTALSGGQRHRVALARALAAEPAALLLDEPLSALDPGVRRDVRDALLAVRETSGVAMVLVTHELDDALVLANRVLLLHNGAAIADQPPETLLAQPPSLVVARALGVFTEIPGIVQGGPTGSSFDWTGGTVPAPAGLPTGPAIACVRPHQVQLARANRGDADAMRIVSRRATAHAVQLLVAGQRGAPTHIPIPWDDGAYQIGDSVIIALTQPQLFPVPAPS
jgi:putative spermidine/putrescine transport system ATP-binding protein